MGWGGWGGDTHFRVNGWANMAHDLIITKYLPPRGRRIEQKREKRERQKEERAS